MYLQCETAKIIYDVLLLLVLLFMIRYSLLVGKLGHPCKFLWRRVIIIIAITANTEYLLCAKYCTEHLLGCISKATSKSNVIVTASEPQANRSEKLRFAPIC